MQNIPDFVHFFDGAVIVSDANGIITYLNDRALVNYADEGGAELIGKNLMDCHNESSRRIIQHILETGEKNVYTIEKKGKKKMIYQTPWFKDGVLQGIVELSVEIPFELPHFIRS